MTKYCHVQTTCRDPHLANFDLLPKRHGHRHSGVEEWRRRDAQGVGFPFRLPGDVEVNEERAAGGAGVLDCNVEVHELVVGQLDDLRCGGEYNVWRIAAIGSMLPTGRSSGRNRTFLNVRYA